MKSVVLKKYIYYNVFINFLPVFVTCIFTLTFNLFLIAYRQQDGLIFSSIFNIILIIINFNEASLILATILHLYKPVQNKDYKQVNIIIASLKKRSLLIGIVYGLLTIITVFLFNKFWTLPNGIEKNIFTWFIVLIAGRNIVNFIFISPYNCLLQAENKNYINCLIELFCNIICYIFMIWYLYSYKAKANMVLIAGTFFLTVILRLIIIKFVFFKKYKLVNWFKILKTVNDKELMQDYKNIYNYNFLEAFSFNCGIVILALFIRIDSAALFFIFISIFYFIKQITLTLILSIRDSLAINVIKYGRIFNKTFVMFEIYAFVIIGLSFLIQVFGISSVFWWIFEKLKIPWSDSVIKQSLNNNWFSLIIGSFLSLNLLYSIDSALLYAQKKHKKVMKFLFIICFLQLLILVVSCSWISILNKINSNAIAGWSLFDLTIYSVYIINIIAFIIKKIYYNFFTYTTLIYNGTWFKNYWTLFVMSMLITISGLVIFLK